MAESLINSKRRINSIKSTEKITKAMKLVSSVKFQRWKRYYEENKAYSKGMEELLEKALVGIDFKKLKKENAILNPTDGKKDLYLLVTSSLGLCGSYNYALFKELENTLKEEDDLLFIGQKGFIHYKEKGDSSDESYLNLLDNSYSYGKVKNLRHALIRLYKEGQYKNIYLVYTHYKNSMTFLPMKERLLPIDLDDKIVDKEDSVAFEPLCDPSQEEVLELLIPRALDSKIYTLLLEAEISELASRRNAMETATDSADKIVQQLMIVYNKTRQNAITQEITEVVSGANAGKKDEE